MAADDTSHLAVRALSEKLSFRLAAAFARRPGFTGFPSPVRRFEYHSVNQCNRPSRFCFPILSALRLHLTSAAVKHFNRNRSPRRIHFRPLSSMSFLAEQKIVFDSLHSDFAIFVNSGPNEMKNDPGHGDIVAGQEHGKCGMRQTTCTRGRREREHLKCDF